MSKHKSPAALIKEYVEAVLLSERRRKHRHKPGGPRTDLGALRQLHPAEFDFKVRTAVDNAEGDVPAAADELDVATRTLYHYLSDSPGLAGVKTTADLPSDDE